MKLVELDEVPSVIKLGSDRYPANFKSFSLTTMVFEVINYHYNRKQKSSQLQKVDESTYVKYTSC